MHTNRSSRVFWTFAAGFLAVGLACSASVALALSGNSSPASSDASAASDSPAGTDEPTDSAEPTDSDSPSETGSPKSTPVGPDATGPAAFGLCTAYEHAKVHGQSVDHSIAFRNLAAAAGGADQIDAYCATILHPGSHTSSPSTGSTPDIPSPSHPTGRPTSVPSHSHPSRG